MSQIITYIKSKSNVILFSETEKSNHMLSNKWVVLPDFLYLEVVNMSAYIHPAGYYLEALGAN